MNFKHGQAKKGQVTAEHMAYRAAKNRCTNTRGASYHRYGGRGVEFLFLNFEQFYAELGPRPSPQHSVDRRNNEGHYEPGNVRWATKKEQAQNRIHGKRPFFPKGYTRAA